MDRHIRRRSRVHSGFSRWAAALGLVTTIIGAAVTAPPALASRPQPPAAEKTTEDTLIFRDGRVVKGKVLEETDDLVKFRGKVAGLEVVTEYKKADLLEVRRAAPEPAGKPKPAAKDPAAPAAKPAAAPASKTEPEPAADDGASKRKVYVMELTGKFGRDISQTPLRQAMEDAKKFGAETVIVVMDNDWSIGRGFKQELGDDAAAFDQLFRAEDMDPVFSNELDKWSKRPEIVFWVKKAMGGASFLPLVSPNIYFHEEGRMGGIGNLTRMFEGVGDDVVRQKQYSLRLGHAEGMAGKGGYSYQIVRAMAVPEYVLSYTIDGGHVKYLERMPENPSEFLLTDDAEEENADDLRAVVAGEGNDVLTLNAKLAKDLELSKGTVNSEDDLLYELGLSRNADRTEGRSKTIFKSWSTQVDTAERDIARLMEEVDQVQPGNTFEERTKARGQQKNLLRKLIGIIERYGEALPRYKGMLPGLLDRIKQIENEQIRDAQQQKR